MKQRILIFGGGSQAKVIIDLIEQCGHYDIAGVVDERLKVTKRIRGYQILSNKLDRTLLKKTPFGFVAIGDNWIRKQFVERISREVPEFQFPPLIHPSSDISPSTKIGSGTVVMAGTTITNDTIIGNHCIVNTGANVDHDCILEDFVSIGPGCTLGGSVVVSFCSAVALGANVIHERTIGPHSIIGAGATVLKDIPSHCTAYGTPARVVRKRRIGDPYL
ncbi:acetyltransferase [Fictibacillus sp. UD]|uniref:acetyltransferase n=1 Tax=Fictibacillus sp. UD TaxID=3038777 RepID=UPI0037459E7F